MCSSLIIAVSGHNPSRWTVFHFVGRSNLVNQYRYHCKSSNEIKYSVQTEL